MTDLAELLVAGYRVAFESAGLDESADFFILGGDSLTAVEIAAFVKHQAPDVLLEVVDIFDYATPRAIADALEHRHLSQP